jgi:hypothetical protein
MVSENEKLVVFLTEGLKTLNLHSAVKTERDSDSELWIHLLDLGVSVFVDDEGGKRQTISGGITVPSYQVYTIESYPATREQPEETGETMRHECNNVAEAVAEVFSLVAKDRIYGMIEAVGLEMDLGFTPGVRADGIPTPDPKVS